MADDLSQSTTRSVPTTTHGEWGGGNPRLLVSGPDARFVHELGAETTRVGSSADNELVLAGAAPLHALVEHEGRDEYVLTMLAPGDMNANPATSVVPGHVGERSEVLRTGARFTAGPWTLVFSRSEFADHGRPFGGRQGGEFAHQRRQGDPPDYSEHAPPPRRPEPPVAWDPEG